MAKLGDFLTKDQKTDLYESVRKHILNLPNVKQNSWDDYEKQFYKLIQNREIESTNKNLLEDACLLCSEDKPHHCHRRLVAEYLEKNWSSVEIIHL